MKPLILAADEFAFHKSHAILSAEFLRRNKWVRQLTIYRLLPYIQNSRVTGAVSTYGKFPVEKCYCELLSCNECTSFEMFCNRSDKSASAVSSFVSPLTFLETNVGDDKSTFSEKKN